MSLFRTISLNCPSCATPLEYELVHSVNADRRPDLRQAILDGSFQTETCPSCGYVFRLEPEFTYVELGAGLWIAADPIAQLPAWKAREAAARRIFDEAYGGRAPPTVRELAHGVQPRLTFGWGALREKLLARQHAIADDTLELAKLLLVRHHGGIPIGEDIEMRLTQVDAQGVLRISVLRSATQLPEQELDVPRKLLDEVDADPAAWEGLRAQFADGLLVDVARMMVPGDAELPEA